MTQYNEEFKTQAVELALNSNQAYSHTAKELGINPKNLYNWISLAGKGSISCKKLSVKQRDVEHMKLLKENKRLKQEVAILKSGAHQLNNLS
jgi:transposase-like protein